MKFFKRFVIGIMIILALLVVCAEAILRLGFGLGTPVLSVADPEIDYYHKPNQDVKRFGRHIVYNNVGMRCEKDYAPEWKGYGVLVLGDSIVNGGVLTEQGNLATEIVQQKHPDWRVYNVSAGSWGPGNCAAFIKKFGTFNAQDIIVEVNSHDLWEDDPAVVQGNTVDIDPDYPGKNPACAIAEFWTRYVPKILEWKLGLDPAKFGFGKPINRKVDMAYWDKDHAADIEQFNLKKLEELFFAYQWRRKTLVIHRSRKETQENVETEGERKFVAWARSKNVEVRYLTLTGDDYRDIIHMNDSGNRKFATLIEEICK